MKSPTSTIPASAYHCKDTYAHETERIFGRTWSFLCHKNEIKEDNAYVVRKIGTEDVIVVHQGNEEYAVYINICPHRSAKLVTAVEGNCKGRFVCPYHAWTFNVHGKLIAVPAQEHHLKDMAMDDHRLVAVKCELWNGLVFANLDPNCSSLAAALGKFPEYLGEYSHPIEDMELVTTVIMDVPVNWKIIVENYVEDYHFSFVHPQTLKVFDHKATQTMPTGDNIMVYMPYRQTKPAGPCKYPWATIGGSPQGFIWPTMTIQPAVNHLSIFQIIPLEPEKTVVQIPVYQTPDQTRNWPMNIDELTENIHTDMEEDFVICREMQRNTHSRHYRIGALSNPHELGIELFANVWWKYMG